MREVFEFPSTDKTHQLHAVKWEQKGPTPRAILQIVHGMMEYAERYDEFANHLSEKGILVIGHDQLGHGQSASDRELGFFNKKAPCRTLIEDIHRLRLIISREYPDVPYFMMGHSMGSYLLRTYLTDYSDELAGAVVMGTGFIPESVTGFGIGLTKSLARIKGSRSHSDLIEGMVFGGGSYKDFDLTGIEPEKSWLTKDTYRVKKYYADDRCSFRFTINGYQGLFQAVKGACSRKAADHINKELPILIISGADDPVGDLGKGPKKAYDMYEKAGIKDLTLKLYEGDRHEILNELDRDQIYSDIFEWIEKRY